MSVVHVFNKIERNDFSNFNCHFWKGQNAPTHCHEDYYEIIICFEKFFETIDEETFVRQTADVVVLKPMVKHSIKVIDQNSEHFNIAIKKGYFENFIDNMVGVKNYLLKNGHVYATLDSITFFYVKNLANKLNNTKYDSLSLTIVQSIIYAIFSSILPTFLNYEELSDKSTFYANDFINKINDGTYIEKNVKDLYPLYPISHTTLINTFKKITDKTPSKYLMDKKLEYAKNLLLTTNDTVLEVSLKIGFESVSHFIKVFKSKFNLTPFQLRQIDKNNISPELVSK